METNSNATTTHTESAVTLTLPMHVHYTHLHETSLTLTRFSGWQVDESVFILQDFTSLDSIWNWNRLTQFSCFGIYSLGWVENDKPEKMFWNFGEILSETFRLFMSLNLKVLHQSADIYKLDQKVKGKNKIKFDGFPQTDDQTGRTEINPKSARRLLNKIIL